MHNFGFLYIRSTFNLIGGFVVSTGMIVMLVILAVLIIALVALYFFGKKAEKKQAEQKDSRYQKPQSLIPYRKR